MNSRIADWIKQVVTGCAGDQVFISYRRLGGSDFARNVRDALQRRRYRVFLDVENLRGGDFNIELYNKIDSSTDFIVVLTAGSLDRCNEQRKEEDWLRLEIAHALERGKNVVPVMDREFKWPEGLPSDIDRLRYKNGIERSHMMFDESMDRLATQFLRSRRRPFIPCWAQAAVATVLMAVGILQAGRWMDIRLLDRRLPVEKVSVTARTLEQLARRIDRDADPSSARATSDDVESDAPEGINSLAGLDRAVREARRWNPNASLRIVVAKRWANYGPAGRIPQISMIRVSEWEYTFYASGEGLDVVVSADSVRSGRSTAGSDWLKKLAPLERWTVDAQGAIGGALAAGAMLSGNGVLQLKMMELRGTQTPIWLVPCQARSGGASMLVDANTGNPVDLKDVRA